MATKNTERAIAPSGFTPNLRVIPGTGGGGDVAEYIQPSASKLDSGFYVTDRGLPWHVTLAQRLGQDPLMVGSDRKLTVGEALVLAGLDWEVEAAPLYGKVGDAYIPVPRKVATVRKDTGAVLGAGMTTGFKIVQNRDAFTFGDYLLDTPGAHIETAGSLYGGAAVFVSFEIPDDVHVAGDPSDYRLFLLVSNGHDGNHRLRIDVTIERVVCRNTLRIAHDRALSSWSIRHTSGLDGRVTAAREALGLSHRYVEDFNLAASAMASTKLADRQVDELLTKLFPMTEAQAKRVEEDPDKVLVTVQGKVRSIYDESPSVAPVRGTAYGLFNAVTEYVDHAKTFRDGVSSAAENRAEALMWDDSASDPKRRAWDLLTTVAGGKTKRK